MPRRKASDNLNARFSVSRQPFSVGQATVVFDPADIIKCLASEIKRAAYCQANLAWCTNPKLLKYLLHCRGCAVIINHDLKLIRKHRAEYEALPPMDGTRMAVRTVKGKGRSLMHHKFCVFLDAKKRPISVVTGSFNWTQQSTKNCEHIVVLRSPALAARFLEEFKAVRSISKAIRKRIKKKK